MGDFNLHISLFSEISTKDLLLKNLFFKFSSKSKLITSISLYLPQKNCEAMSQCISVHKRVMRNNGWWHAAWVGLSGSGHTVGEFRWSHTAVLNSLPDILQNRPMRFSKYKSAKTTDPYLPRWLLFLEPV